MSLPPIASATLQSAVLSGTSNVLAQALTAYRADKPFTLDWVPVIQFIVYAAISTPPNFLWQDFLETAFPAQTIRPTNAAISSASANNEKELDKEAVEGTLVESGGLNIRNTAIKFVLDQTIGAVFNTLLFGLFMHSVQAATLRAVDPTTGKLVTTVDYGVVNWNDVWAKSTGGFWSIVMAGWKLWPWVALFNFVFVKSIETRNLVGSLAGIVWGIYMSLVAAR